MSPIRLLLAAGLSVSLAASAAAQPAAQTIYLWSYGYSPNPIYLQSGRPVTLTFVNRSGKSHDFVARSFFGSSRILAGHVMGGMIDLRGGESKTVRLIPRAGVYKVHCSHFFHKQLGMTDRIVVR